MKYVLVIGDGMADNPVEELGGKTPLEYAEKPVIDEMCAKSVLGSVVNCPKGLPAGSETAIMSIFGCDPKKYFTGRAPLEAAATGIKLAPGDVAYRCNMVTLEDAPDKAFEDKKILSHSAGSIDGDVSDEIITMLFEHPVFRALADKAGMSINLGHSFRHIAVQKGADISGIKLIPPHDHLGEVIGPLLPSGCANAEVLKELMKTAHDILDTHPLNERLRYMGEMPANGIWFWAEGSAAAMPNFVEAYGEEGGVVSAVPLCHGIAALTGLEPVHVEGATGEIDTNLENKVAAAIEVLERHNFVCLHFEAPDECTHNGDLAGKIQGIEWLDSRVVAPLARAFGEHGWDYRMLILSDHKTLTSTRGHDGDPVPYMIYDSRRDTGCGLSYTEKNGLKGELLPEGDKLMGLLFEK